MPIVKVWSPFAKEIELISGEEVLGMHRDETAWWAVEAPGVQHGSDYGFRIDRGAVLPDPRSPWQPAGVHGLSRRVDHSLFEWSDAGWRPPPLGAALIYELHVGSFTPQGTFEAVIQKLDHLLELGVTHIELMPVAEFSGNRGWGYDGVDPYAPHHAYGGPAGLKKLVDTCHRRGLAVILDVVYNHLGPSGNYLGSYGPYFTDRYKTPWGDAVNFDGPWSHEVRRYCIENALMWLRDYHFDGLRLDAVHAIIDTSAVHFLEELAAAVACLNAEVSRQHVLIAESDLNDPRIVRPPEAGGYGLDAQWNEDFHHALHAVLTREQGGYYRDFGHIADLAKVFSTAFVYDGRYSAHRERYHGRPATGLPGSRFVGCLQNHDQIGNRATGDRTAGLLSPGQLKIGAALVFFAPYIPMLFQGEEWAASTPFLYFCDHQEKELAEAVRQGRREEFAAFGWDTDRIPDPQAASSFESSVLRWREVREDKHQDMLNWYRSLAELRRSLPDLRDPRIEGTRVHYSENEEWMTVQRGSVLLTCNFGPQARTVECAGCREASLLLASDSNIDRGQDEVGLPGYSVVMFALK